MAAKKSTGRKGQIPLPFEKGKRIRARPVYSRKAIEKAKRLHSIRSQARSITSIFNSRSTIIMRSGITIRPDVAHDLRVMKSFLEKFNKEHGPSFDISELRERNTANALRRFNANWSHVIEDAKKELDKIKQSQSKQKPLGL